MKKSSKKRVRTAITSVINRAAPESSPSSNEISPSTTLVKKSSPTARTNGAAYGSSIRGSGSRLATARAAATIVAVDPTLDARSQRSPSVRAIASRATWSR